MNPEERTLLSDLFRHLRDAESQPRDAEAERFIQEMLQGQPAAPYYMAQAVLVQQQALAGAQKRIEELERQVKEAQSRAQPAGGGGSFLSNALGRGGPWGGGEPVRSPAPAVAPDPARSPAPPVRGTWGAPPPPAGGYARPGQGQPGFGGPGFGPQAQASGGGFLRGAAQTAAGVAGGMIAASAISSMFSHSPGPFGGAGAADAAHQAPDQGFAAPAPEMQTVDYQSDDPGFDDPGFDDSGSDDPGFDDPGSDGGDEGWI